MGLGCEAWGLGLGFKVWGAGVGVWGFGFRFGDLTCNDDAVETVGTLGEGRGWERI